jgi:hypothetical protein
MGFQIGFPALRNYPSAGPVYDADVQAWINARAAAGDAVPTAYANAVDAYVVALKAISGHWATITQFVVAAGATTINGACIAIKGPNLTPINMEDADVTLKGGITGNGTNEYLSTGYAQSSFSQNNIHAYGYFTNAGSAATETLWGAGSTANGSFVMRRTATNYALRCHNATGDTVSTTPAAGELGMSRSASDGYTRLVLGSTATIGRTSQAPTSRLLYLLASSGPSDDSPISFSTARILVWAIGTATTISNYTTPTANLVTALNAI